MKVLVTSARNPFAVDIVRKLADVGHQVWAADTFEAAAGSHSRYVEGHVVTASPRHATARFVADIEAVVDEHGIDVIVPTFEEAFYLATRHDQLSGRTRLFTGRFDQLARLHDKATFQPLAAEAGATLPETRLARNDAELRDAIAAFPQYFARASFSRGGVALLTNAGPMAGRVDVADCHPDPDQPWLVQEYVSGPMVCSYSTVHDSQVTAHVTYRIPHQWEHTTGISFHSIDSGETLPVVENIARETSYTGQLSFDWLDNDGKLYLIECNPRTTDGTLLMTPEQLAAGLTDPHGELSLVPEGIETQLDFALVANVFKEPLRRVPQTIHELLHLHDVSRGWHDHMPMAWSFLTLARAEWLSHKQRVAVLEAMADDIVWNGEPIAGMSEADAQALAEVHAQRS